MSRAYTFGTQTFTLVVRIRYDIQVSNNGCKTSNIIPQIFENQYIGASPVFYAQIFTFPSVVNTTDGNTCTISRYRLTPVTGNPISLSNYGFQENPTQYPIGTGFIYGWAWDRTTNLGQTVTNVLQINAYADSSSRVISSAQLNILAFSATPPCAGIALTLTNLANWQIQNYTLDFTFTWNADSGPDQYLDVAKMITFTDTGLCGSSYWSLISGQISSTNTLETFLMPGFIKSYINIRSPTSWMWSTKELISSQFTVIGLTNAQVKAHPIWINISNQCTTPLVYTNGGNSVPGMLATFALGDVSQSAVNLNIIQNAYFQTPNVALCPFRSQALYACQDRTSCPSSQHNTSIPASTTNLSSYELSLPISKYGVQSFYHHVELNLADNMQNNTLNPISVVVCGAETLAVNSTTLSALQPTISGLQATKVDLLFDIQPGTTGIWQYQSLSEYQHFWEVSNADSPNCTIKNFVLCQYKDTNCDSSLSAKFEVMLSLCDSTVSTTTGQPLNCKDYKYQQGVYGCAQLKSHFDPSLTVAPTTGHSWFLKYQNNDILMTRGYTQFNLGVVTNGYVMISLQVKMLLTCNKQVITAPTQSLNTFQFTQNSGLQQVVKTLTLMDHINSGITPGFTTNINFSICPITSMSVDYKTTTKLADNQIWISGNSSESTTKVKINTKLIDPGTYPVQLAVCTLSTCVDVPFEITILAQANSTIAGITPSASVNVTINSNTTSSGANSTANTTSSTNSNSTANTTSSSNSSSVASTATSSSSSVTQTSAASASTVTITAQSSSTESAASEAKTTKADNEANLAKAVAISNTKAPVIETTSQQTAVSATVQKGTVSSEAYNEQYVAFQAKIAEKLRAKGNQFNAYKGFFSSSGSSQEVVVKKPVIPKLQRNGKIAVHLAEPIIVPSFITSQKRQLGRNLIALSQINAIRDVLNVNLIVNSDVDPAKIKYEVLITEWTSEDFSVFVNFTNPLLVSLGNIPDKLVMSVKNPYLFISQKTGEPIDVSNLDQTIILPRMLPKNVDQKALNDGAKNVAATAKSFVAIQIILQVFLKGSMEDMWGAFFALQMLVYVTLYDIQLPGNSLIYIEQFRNLVDLQFMHPNNLLPLIHKGWSIDYFKTTVHIKVTRGLNQTGIKSGNIMMNLQTYILMSVLFVCALLFLLILYVLCKFQAKVQALILKKMKDTLDKMFFNGLIKSHNISFVKTVIAFSVAYQEVVKQHQDDFQHTAASLGGVLFWAFFLVAIAAFLLVKRDSLGTPQAEERFGRLTVDVHLTRNEYNIIYHQVFFMKRFFFLVIPMLIFPDQQTFQIISIVFVNLFYFMYYIGTRPHITFRKTFVEASNELMIHIAIFHMFLFTDFVASSEMKFQIGYWLVFVLLLVLFANIIFMIHNGFNKFKHKARAKRIQKRYEAKFKAFQENVESNTIYNQTLLKQTEYERAKFFYHLTYGEQHEDDSSESDEDLEVKNRRGKIKSLYFKSKEKMTFNEFLKDLSLSQVDEKEEQEEESFRESTNANVEDYSQIAPIFRNSQSQLSGHSIHTGDDEKDAVQNDESFAKVVKAVPEDVVPILQLQRMQIQNINEMKHLIIAHRDQSGPKEDVKKFLEELNEQNGSAITDEELRLQRNCLMDEAKSFTEYDVYLNVIDMQHKYMREDFDEVIQLNVLRKKVEAAQLDHQQESFGKPGDYEAGQKEKGFFEGIGFNTAVNWYGKKKTVDESEIGSDALLSKRSFKPTKVEVIEGLNASKGFLGGTLDGFKSGFNWNGKKQPVDEDEQRPQALTSKMSIKATKVEVIQDLGSSKGFIQLAKQTISPGKTQTNQVAPDKKINDKSLAMDKSISSEQSLDQSVSMNQTQILKNRSMDLSQSPDKQPSSKNRRKSILDFALSPEKSPDKQPSSKNRRKSFMDLAFTPEDESISTKKKKKKNENDVNDHDEDGHAVGIAVLFNYADDAIN